MHDNYSDIKDRITEEPAWYDQNGCPRYGKFTPQQCPDIYSNTVVLIRIACQSCNQQFNVQMSVDFWGTRHPPKNWHYGDPPRHDCPGAGETMNCEDLDILEVWHRAGIGDWKRVRKLEGIIP